MSETKLLNDIERVFTLPRAMQMFRNQKGGQRKRLLAVFRKFVMIVSGSDDLEFLKSFKSTRYGTQIHKLITENQNDNLFHKLGSIHKQLTANDRISTLALVCNEKRSKKELRNAGFQFGQC